MTEGKLKKTNWPVFRSLASFRPSDLPGDLIAGLTLAAIAIPEQMATARLGGFSPQIGFFAFIAGSLGFAMFGSNRFLSCGADSTITPIFAGGLVLLAASGSPEYQALALALALMVGVILIAGSLFRLGWIANRPLVYLGTISYSWYLLHENIGWAIMLRLYEFGTTPNLAIAIALASTVLLASALTFVVEKPALNYIRAWYRAREKTRPRLQSG